MSGEKLRIAILLSVGSFLALSLCIGRPVAAAEDAAKTKPARQAVVAKKGHATSEAVVAKVAVAQEEGVVAPPRLPPGFDIDRLMRQVHFAYRPDGGGFSGGDSTYSVRVDGTGNWSVRPLHRPAGLAPGLATAPKPRTAIDGGRPELADKLVKGTALRVSTLAIGAEKASTRHPASKVGVAADGRLTITHGLAVESLRNTHEGVEQSWAFERRPAGIGDLVVRVAVSGQRYSGETQNGLHFVDPDTGLGLRYGVATWVDATGRRTEVRPRYLDGEIVMTLPAALLANAGFPAVLDPVLSPELGTDNPVSAPVVNGAGPPRIVYDGTSNYLVVWSDARESQGLWGARVDASTGALLDPSGIALALNDNFNLDPEGAACASTQCLVTWGVSTPTGVRELHARFFSKTSGTFTGSELVIWSDPQAFGGDVAFNGTNYLVGYSFVRPGQSFVVGKIVTPAGVVDPPFIISPDNQIGQLRVPVIASDGTNFYAAWAEQTLAPTNQFFFFVYGRGIQGDGGGLLGAQAGVTPTSETWNHSRFERPSLVWDGANHYVVAWTDERAGVATTDIWVRRVSSTTFVPEASQLQLTTDGGSQRLAALARSETSLLAVWNDARSTVAVFGQSLTSGGSLALSGGNFSIAGDAVSSFTPSVASDGTNYAIAYSNNQDSGSFPYEVYAAGVTASGDAHFALERVSNSANAQVAPALGFDGTNFLAVWADSRNAPDPNSIYGARISASGTVLDTGGIAISVTSVGSSPQVAFASATSSYLVVWGRQSGVSARRVNTDGSTPSAERSVPVPGSTPSVASDGTNFLVVSSVPQSDSPGDMGGALLGPDANPLSGSITISTSSSPASTAVAYSPSARNYLVVWSDLGDIYGQRLTISGSRLDGDSGFVISSASNTQTSPSVAFDGSNYAVVFSDARNVPSHDIFAARVSTGGAVLDADRQLSPIGPHNERSPRVTFDGTHLIVAWLDGGAGEVVASRVATDLSTVLDDPPLAIAAGATIGAPALASNRQGVTLIAYSRFDSAPGLMSRRVHERFLSNPAQIGTTTAIETSVNPSSFGQSVTFTATVSAGTGTPSGTVQFKADDAPLGAPATLVGGIGTVSTASLSVGAHIITAEYGGSGTFLASAGMLSPNQTVNPAPATITLGNLNQTYDGSPKPATATTTPSGLSGVTLTYDGSATTPTNAGSYAVVASLTNPDYQAPDATGTLVIAPAGTSTSVASSLNPATLGQGVTFTASVSSSGGTPTMGTVTFKDGAAILGAQTLTAGQASLTTAALAPGSHLITAAYGGSANFSGSTSPALTQSVSYSFAGFFPPLDNPPTLNAVNAGSAAPVKFSLGGNQGLDKLAPGYPTSGQLPCDSTAEVNTIEETTTAGSSGLSYDATSGQYVYIWKTDRAWANTCRQLVVKLKDGAYHRANFKLK